MNFGFGSTRQHPRGIASIEIKGFVVSDMTAVRDEISKKNERSSQRHRSLLSISVGTVAAARPPSHASPHTCSARKRYTLTTCMIQNLMRPKNPGQIHLVQGEQNTVFTSPSHPHKQQDHL